MKKTQVIILAGGKGTRMESELPKALVQLGGKPFLKHVLDMVERTGLPGKPVIVVGYKKEDVMNALEKSYTFAVQEEQLGTGHAVKMAQPHIDPSIGTVVVLFTDHPFISEKTILKLIEKREETNATVVMATALLPDFDDWRANFYKNFSRVKRDAQGKMLRTVEFKDTTEEEKNIKEVNPCYFAFDAQWMWEKLKDLDNQNTSKEYHLTDLVKFAFRENKLIETISIDPKEALAANSIAELAILEEVLKKQTEVK